MPIENLNIMAGKPSIPKGTRDFSPNVLGKRNHIFDTIRSVYSLYGYMPIETPAMELMETLTGKYGDEGDKLLFRVLNSGDFLKGVEDDVLQQRAIQSMAPKIADKGLRYDLTIPFARYVVQHRNDITMPFKRYQLQPVWRADRPQKGRYREFFQCDADVIGSTSLTNELELIQMIDEVFSRLDVAVHIRVNNRKILYGVAEVAGLADQFYPFTIAIDKLDKIGVDGVAAELKSLGCREDMISRITQFVGMKGDNSEQMAAITSLVSESEIGMKGVDEMNELLQYHHLNGTRNALMVDITLARGLNYYTGTIFEVNATDVAMGSLCGGGRYDDLTGVFGMPGLSGVGISFGADRIYDVMEELQKFGAIDPIRPQVLLINFGGDDMIYSLNALFHLRKKGVASELYPDAAKIKKQMTYADARKIPFVVLAGEQERAKSCYTIKNMQSGEQQTVDLDGLVEMLS